MKKGLFFRKRVVFFPTFVGWLLLFVFCFSLTALWLFCGESFLSRTSRSNASYLVIECWIGKEGIRAAADEFFRERYGYVVVTGGPASDRWNDQIQSYAAMGLKELVRLGIPESRILVTATRGSDRQRTFEMASSALEQISKATAAHEYSLTVFTKGAHARRSQLVFARVFGSEWSVGVIGWLPIRERGKRWWHLSERASDFLKESFGYVYELIFYSGRWGADPQ